MKLLKFISDSFGNHILYGVNFIRFDPNAIDTEDMELTCTNASLNLNYIIVSHSVDRMQSLIEV